MCSISLSMIEQELRILTPCLGQANFHLLRLEWSRIKLVFGSIEKHRNSGFTKNNLKK